VLRSGVGNIFEGKLRAWAWSGQIVLGPGRINSKMSTHADILFRNLSGSANPFATFLLPWISSPVISYTLIKLTLNRL
jgi:hypothetical protein